MLVRLLSFVAPAGAFAGAAAFFVATFFLMLERCGSCTGFLEGMDRTPGLSTSAKVVLAIVAVVALLGRWGRGIALGFAGALAFTAIGTAGKAAFVWGVPSSRAPVAALAPAAPRPGPSASPNAEARILELQQRELDERAGGRLLYRLIDCIAVATPVSADQITADCQDLRTSREGYAGPERFSDADPGWRWSYGRYSIGFQVEVYPDTILNKTTPHFIADQTGRTTVQRAGGGPPVYYPRPR